MGFGKALSLIFFVAVAFVKPVYFSIPTVCISLGFSIQGFSLLFSPHSTPSQTNHHTKKNLPNFSNTEAFREISPLVIISYDISFFFF